MRLKNSFKLYRLLDRKISKYLLILLPAIIILSISISYNFAYLMVIPLILFFWKRMISKKAKSGLGYFPKQFYNIQLNVDITCIKSFYPIWKKTPSIEIKNKEIYKCVYIGDSSIRIDGISISHLISFEEFYNNFKEANEIRDEKINKILN